MVEIVVTMVIMGPPLQGCPIVLYSLIAVWVGKLSRRSSSVYGLTTLRPCD